MESEGLVALERLMTDYYEMCQDLGNNDDQYQRCNLTSERAIIEKELKAKANLVSMCENLAKLVGLKEKDYVELETLITKKLKTLEQLEIMYSNCVIEGAKQKKALDIIKNIGILKPYETIGGQCWLETMCDATKITKGNCDLLKEVLK